MAIKNSKWYRYVVENGHRFVLWFVFLFVTAILVFLTVKIIEVIPNKKAASPSVEEVKIYFPKNEPDTLYKAVTGKLIEIQETIDSMRKDSISVSVQKVAK